MARASGTSSGAPARTKSFCMSTTSSAGAARRSAGGTWAATRGSAAAMTGRSYPRASRGAAVEYIAPDADARDAARAARRRGAGGAPLAADARGRGRPRGGRRRPHAARRRRQDGADARPHGPPRGARPAHRRASPASATRPWPRRWRRRASRRVRADLLDRATVAALPRVPNVILMAGHKFGTTDAPSRTWATNTVLPGFVAEAFAESRIVAFSTGNVYPFVPVDVRRRDRAGAAAAGARRLRGELPRPRARAALVLRDARHARASSTGSTTRSTCATACSTTSPARCATASPST